MSEAQRCANVMRRYGLNHAPDSIARGCYDATCRELERQEHAIHGLEGENVAMRELFAMVRLCVEPGAMPNPEFESLCVCTLNGINAALQPKEPTC